MRKLTLLITMLFLSVGMAWAQPEVSDAPSGGKWSENTHWYQIKTGNGYYLRSDILQDDSKLALTNNTATIEDVALWCFVGNDNDGYTFYNKAKGPNAPLAMYGANADAYAVLTEDPTDADTKFDFTESKKTGDYWCLKEHGTDNNYWNRRNNRLAYWESSDAVNGWGNSGNGDDGSALLFTEVSIEELDCEFTDKLSGNVFTGTCEFRNNDISFPGCTLEDVVREGNKLTASITFPFPVSKEGGVIGITTIASFSDSKKWHFVDNEVRVKSSGYDENSDGWLWNIYPKFSNGRLFYTIKSVGANKWLFANATNSELDTDDNDTGADNAVTLADEGTEFSIAFWGNNSNPCFQYRKENKLLYLSINSKDDADVNLGVHNATHQGTECHFNLVRSIAPVAKIGEQVYYTFEDALAAAQADETITLVADVTCAEKPVFNNGGVVNVDINGHKFVSSEKARVRCVASADGTVASNNIKFVRGFGWEAYYNADEKFRVFPTLDEAVAYKSGTNAANIYPYENVVQDKDITFRTTGEQTSTALTNDAGYKTSWDLNGFTVLQETAAGNPLESTVLGEFTLLDSSAEKEGKWIAGAYNGNTGGGPAFIVNRADAHLILQGGTISIARNGDVVNTGGLINTYYGTLTVDGATLQMDDLYGIMAWGGNVVVNSGEFVLGENNSSSVFAKNYYSDASVTINKNLGGTLYAHSSAEAIVNVAGVKYYVSGTDYVAPKVGEGLVAQGGVVGYPVAKIGETGYLTLEAAVAAALDNETVTLVNNVALETPVVISGKALTLDLGAYTIEDKSTAVLTDEDDVWALIDLENGANLTVCGTGTIKANYANVQGGWTGMAYCINVDKTSKLTVDGGNFINGNGGVQTRGEVVVNGGTFVSHNGGTCIMAIDTKAKVTVNGGTFKDSVEESDVYTGSGAVWAGFGAKIEIKGGTFDFAADPEHGNVVWTLFPAQNAIAGTGVNAEMAVSGGTFVNFNPAEDVIVDYSPSTGFTFGSVVAEGYAVVANGDGTYSVEEKVELPEVVITDIKGSLTDSDPDLTFALNFAIKDVENLDPEYLEKLFAQYGDWYTDYVLTISGLTDEDVTFNANGNADGYLAGQYDAWSENWVSVPFEDVTLANGASIYIMEYAAKLMNKQGLRFTLAEVAEIVQNFDCGVYFTPEFLAANPGLKVDLHLKVFTEDAEGNKVNDINVATNNFDIEDYVAIVHAAGKQTQYCTTLADAVAAAADGATITMLRDVELTEAVKVVGKAITLDLNGKTVSGVCNSNQGHLVYIENGAGLTVKDGAVDGGGKLTYAQGTSNVGWTVAVMGNLTLESGTIELTGEWSIGYAVDVRPNAWGVAYTAPSMFTMNGGNVVSSDGAVRVASSSSDQYADVSASFVMNGGEIDAAWDGVFIQQSNAAYDVLNFTITGGTIKSGLNPVRVYGPAPTSYVNGQECMSINFNGGTMTYTGTETREWVIDGVLRVGGGSSIETIVENGNITAGEAFAQAQALPDGYKWEQDGETYKVVKAPAIAKVGETYYATLADAVAAAEGETVTMLADVELTESLVIAAGKEVVLDLNGKTVSQSKECTASYAMITNNGSLTITGNGKLSFTDTSAGDPSFGWGSYTINNCGTLVVENGTIEHLGTQAFAKHMICAIFQYSGSTTINGGTISTPNYRSARLWHGDMTINGGEFDGQLWVQAVDDSAKLTINGGTFSPNGGDASSVFVGNVDSQDRLCNVEFAVTDGTFTTKIGCSNAAEIAGDGIKGGKFTESAMNNTNSALLAEGFVFADEAVDGYYGIVADPSYIAELVIDDAKGENYTNDTEKTVGTLTYKRTLVNGKWNALYLPFEVELTDELLANYDFADYNQMISHDTNGDRVPDSFEMEVFIYTSGTLEANYPYFVRPKNEEACSMNLVLTDATLYPANEISLVTSSVKNTFKLSGTYKAMGAEELAGKYAISTDGDWSYTSALKPYRLYFTITDNNGAFVTSVASKSVRIVVRGEDGTTGVEEITGENGEEMIFDLQGRRVLEPEKGDLYIKNGKKVMVK